MKIAFLLGAMEPGKDGVGDYVRNLASELVHLDHEVFCIALNDFYTSEAQVETIEVREARIKSLRLPANWNWKQRINLAQEHVRSFTPDWISLQFVPYSFESRGLVHGLADKIGPLLNGARLHMMFHEIWLCPEMEWGWLKSLVGKAQLFYIKRFLAKTKPSVAHTSNSHYAAILAKNGIQAKILPLFGNIPVILNDQKWIMSQLKHLFGADFKREQSWLFGFFGSIYPQWQPEPLFGKILAASHKAKRRPCFLSIGRTGKGAGIWKHLEAAYRGRCGFGLLNEQPPDHISEYLAALDFGIATTPRLTIAKSGSAIAMFEHGLPVIVNRESMVKAVYEDVEPMLISCDERFEDRLLKAGKTNFQPRLGAVARMLSESLGAEMASFSTAASASGSQFQLTN